MLATPTHSRGARRYGLGVPARQFYLLILSPLLASFQRTTGYPAPALMPHAVTAFVHRSVTAATPVAGGRVTKFYSFNPFGRVSLSFRSLSVPLSLITSFARIGFARAATVQPSKPFGHGSRQPRRLWRGLSWRGRPVRRPSPSGVRPPLPSPGGRGGRPGGVGRGPPSRVPVPVSRWRWRGPRGRGGRAVRGRPPWGGRPGVPVRCPASATRPARCPSASPVRGAWRRPVAASRGRPRVGGRPWWPAPRPWASRRGRPAPVGAWWPSVPPPLGRGGGVGVRCAAHDGPCGPRRGGGGGRPGGVAIISGPWAGRAVPSPWGRGVASVCQ